MKFPSFKLATSAGVKPPVSWQGSRRRRRTPPSAWLMGLALLLLAMLLGAVIALDSLQLTAMFGGLLFAIPLALWVNTRALLPVLFVVVFLIQGTVQTFLQMRLATWFASGMAGLFLLRALMELLVSRSTAVAGKREAGGQGGHTVIVIAFIYLACFLFSLMLGNATTAQRLSALRFGLPMFGVLFSLYWFQWPLARLQTLWWMFVVVMVLQLPFCVYQHFGPPSRVIGWDAVVGTFGTGMSPSLVMATLAAMIYAVSRWHHGLSRVSLPLAVGVLGLAVILLGEVKAVVLWLPLAMLLALRERISRNVVTFFMYGVFVVVFVVGLFFAYRALYWGEAGSSGNTVEEKLNHTGGYFFDVKSINYRTGEISRGASLYLWYRDPLPSLQERMVGYGPSASQNSQGTGQGVIAKRYRSLNVSATGLAMLLWDVGIVGATLFILLICSGGWAGWRLVRKREAPPEVLAIVDTSTVMMGLFLTTLMYNRNLLDEPTTQLLFFFCLGCIVQFSRFATPQLSKRPPA